MTNRELSQVIRKDLKEHGITSKDVSVALSTSNPSGYRALSLSTFICMISSISHPNDSHIIGLISDVLGCIGECAGGFEKDKKYIFDKDTYIKDMESSDGFDDENLGFASDCDGKEVKVITCGLGIVEDKYPVHPDWCKEVYEEEIIKDMFEPGKKYVFDAELCRKDEYDVQDKTQKHRDSFMWFMNVRTGLFGADLTECS